jgi:hypothetical protein
MYYKRPRNNYSDSRNKALHLLIRFEIACGIKKRIQSSIDSILFLNTFWKVSVLGFPIFTGITLLPKYHTYCDILLLLFTKGRQVFLSFFLSFFF